MSREEELAAKGQLLEDYSHLKQRVATLGGVLERQGILLREAGEHLSSIVDPPKFGSSPEPDWSAILPLEKIQSTLQEFNAENKRLHQLRARLHNVGFPPDPVLMS